MPKGGESGVEKLARIEQVGGIERLLDRLVEGAEFGRGGLGPPFLLRQADAVLPGQDAAPAEDLGKEKIERGAGLRIVGPGRIDHDVDVDVAVAGMAEGGDLDAEFFLDDGAEGE